MARSDIVSQRLCNQHIAGTGFEKPGEVVKWMGAVQAQDYSGALWAVGLRTGNATRETIEQAIADRTIVRTWPMRGTLHFVAAADARWMLKLLTPRVLANRRWLFRQLDLDDATFARCTELVTNALQGGKQLAREAMYKMLEAGGIATANQRGLHILGWLAQTGVICFGVREGKQTTFVLLDEWLPKAKSLEREAALAELAKRYFTSHGPATLQDFMWWSGLTTADAKAAIEMAKAHLVAEVIAGQTYWVSPSLPVEKEASPTAHLLPPYDEYTIAYKDRSAVLNPLYGKQAHSSNGIFFPTIALDGQIIATWKRTLRKNTLLITPNYFAKLNKAQSHAVAEAANRYGNFLGISVVLP